MTAAGVSAGFTLSNVLSGGSNYNWLGAGNQPDGTLAVGSFATGSIFKFNNVDNQTQANVLASVSFSGEIDVTTAGGQVYAASRSQGYFRVSNSLGLTPIATTITPGQGIAGNPVTGDILTIASNGGLYRLNPTTGVATFITTPSSPDGVAVSPDGTVAYVADLGGAVRGYNIASGAQVFTVTGLSGGPDGMGVIVGGTHDGDLVVNQNNGTVALIDDVTKAVTIIASGGQRGDFAQPDHSTGSLLLFNTNAVWRLGINDGGVGTPPTTTPEPASLALLAVAIGSLGVLRRRRLN